MTAALITLPRPVAVYDAETEALEDVHTSSAWLAARCGWCSRAPSTRSSRRPRRSPTVVHGVTLQRIRTGDSYREWADTMPTQPAPLAAHAATEVGADDKPRRGLLTPAGRFWLPYLAGVASALLVVALR